MKPFNFATLNQYQGKNIETLEGPDFPAYATFNQVRDLGGSVKKGAKSVPIFCGYQERDERDPDTKKVKTVSIPLHARVFHINDCELDPGYIKWLKDEIKKGDK